MNIVKGVADLFRRTSGGQTAEVSTCKQAKRFPVSFPRIRFREIGDEAALNEIWWNYENASDQAEKQKLLQFFVMHFLQVYKNWPSASLGEPLETVSSISSSPGSISVADNTYVGCSIGHPAEVILVLIQEIPRLTTLVTDWASTNFYASFEGLHVLDALAIVVRSMHNCKILNHYGGMQKLTALLKAAVVQIKSHASTFDADEHLSQLYAQRISVLERILICVVSIMSSFIGLRVEANENAPIYMMGTTAGSNERSFLFTHISMFNVSPSEENSEWQQKAVALIMEAGSLNWLVEFLRVVMRMTLREQRAELYLQHLTLSILRSALHENLRVQNHFRIIGGIEVILDYLPSARAKENEFHLQILSLEVLREAVFGNLSNLQFLCENGRICKLANDICKPAFLLEGLQNQRIMLPEHAECQMVNLDAGMLMHEESQLNKLLILREDSDSYAENWNAYTVNLSKVLCSFLLAPEDVEVRCIQTSVGRSAKQASLAYWELSVKWIIKVLFSMFCFVDISSCQNELLRHTRRFATTLQHYVLYTFKKILVSLPALIEAFRKEGIWDLIFSEHFFYFGYRIERSCVIPDQCMKEVVKFDGSPNTSEKYMSSTEMEILQAEVISFVEFAASMNGSTHNLPECRVLFDALEQFAYYPETAVILAKSLHRVLELGGERTTASFETLDAVTRMLKVACIEAQEVRRLADTNLNQFSVMEVPQENWELIYCSGYARSLISCIGSILELYAGYLFMAVDMKRTVLHNPRWINYLFDLFGIPPLRKHVLDHILELLKLPPSSDEDTSAKLHLCSKYLEMFTQTEERETGFNGLSVDLLIGIRYVLKFDQMYYQDLFRDAECFLHIVSILNSTDEKGAEELLVLNVLQTLTGLLAGNDASKAAFKALAGGGYKALQSLLLDVCQLQPNTELLNVLLDMLVDGKFDHCGPTVIKNEDVVILLLRILQKSSSELQHFGLDIFCHLLELSIRNQASCFRAGMLSFLLDWFSVEDSEHLKERIVQLIQIIGGYSISGKDVRKIFALLRRGKVDSRLKCCSMLLAAVQFMMKVKGPAAFFELSGNESGIVIKTPIQWPYNRGYTFICWVWVECFPAAGTLVLFNFLTDDGRGSVAMLGKDKVVVETISQTRQNVLLPAKLVEKTWHFLCITHGIGRAFSGGDVVRCYVDGDLVSCAKCRYPRMKDFLTNCSIGTKLAIPSADEEGNLPLFSSSFSFQGQIGPIYLFGEAISSEQMKGIYCSKHSSLSAVPSSNNSDRSLDPKNGLDSKIIFGLHAQASHGNILFNISSDTLEDTQFEAVVLPATQLCCRQMLQQTIHCVGGVSAFFPLLTHFDSPQKPEAVGHQLTLLPYLMSTTLAAEVIELIASVLDDNLANQQHMHVVDGFPILGILLRSVPPWQLNLEAISALKHLLNVVGTSELLVNDAISALFVNPHIWMSADYSVQHELYMFLIQYFENKPSLLTTHCQLLRILDLVKQFFSDEKTGTSAFGWMDLLHSVNDQIISKRPDRDEIHKLRLLLLSLAEMNLRRNIKTSDVSALVAFFERDLDTACIEDVLHMIIRVVSQKPMLISFMEKVHLLGGCHIFVNLLKREAESVRLLALQFLGKLLVFLVGIPHQKKGLRLFSLSAGKSKSLDGYEKANTKFLPIFFSMSDRLCMFPQTEYLCAALFDILLGGASPKQILQAPSHLEAHSKGSCLGSSFSHFSVPQMLILIFNFLSCCEESSIRTMIFKDLVGLLDICPSNIDSLVENAWFSFLALFARLDVVKNYRVESEFESDVARRNEQDQVKNLFCIVLFHFICSVKGGWQQFREAVDFLLLQFEQESCSQMYFLQAILKDVTERLLMFPTDGKIFHLQPCHDNKLFLLRLIDEFLITERVHELPFPGTLSFSNDPSDFLMDKSGKERGCVIIEAFLEDLENQLNRYNHGCMKRVSYTNGIVSDESWNLYDKLWILMQEMSHREASLTSIHYLASKGPTFGQRAWGFMESLNVPTSEVAAAMVSRGIGNLWSGNSNKYIKGEMLLQADTCSRLIFRLVILYLCSSDHDRASRCVEQLVSILPFILMTDDEQIKGRLQFFIWSLLVVRIKYGNKDGGARFKVITKLIHEITNYWNSTHSASILEMVNFANSGDCSHKAAFRSLIMENHLFPAVVDEVKYMNRLKADSSNHLSELRIKMNENLCAELKQKNSLEDLIQTNLEVLVASDDKRRSLSQFASDEYLQFIAGKWAHIFRTLIDERGPWSANPFPSSTVKHWKLDKTEDNHRRRLKLKRNYHFNELLCHPSSPGHLSTVVSDQPGNLGTYVLDNMKQIILKRVHKISVGQTEMYSMESESRHANASVHDPLPDDHFRTETMGQKIPPTLDDESSEVLLSMPCVLVSPKTKLAGHLTITHDFLHFSAEFLVNGTGGSSVFREFYPVDSFKHDISGGACPGSSVEKSYSTSNLSTVSRPFCQKPHRRWSTCMIKSVHWIRYLLQYTAIEIFFSDSSAPIFLNFPSSRTAKDVGMMIVATRNDRIFPKGCSREQSDTISFVDRRMALELAESAQEKWQRREISNFDYLMTLNTLAGRTYSDLTQYPVFPWVLADYSSETLDFNKSSTFRDLSKPIGALDLKRFKVFENRFRHFSDPDIPSFFYGSHYSSMGIVLYYLVRLEPFTALHRNLQGGKFDHADRLFQSIEGTYRNCLSNTSDVKELIPEFFYMPAFLTNSNCYHLGVKQDGEPLGDVALPPWAKGSPEEFIYRNREALESEYVSSNIHHWIDLVFGYQQRGRPAVEAANVFYYLTYEGAVDLEAIQDELQRSAVEDQIANFGQAPIQIFCKKHPRRGPPIPIAHPLYYAPASIALTSIISVAIHPPSAILFVGVLDSTVVLVDQGLTMHLKMWLTTEFHSGGSFTFYGSQDLFYGVGSDVISPRKICGRRAEKAVVGMQCLTTLQTVHGSFVVSCGYWDNSFQVASIAKGKMAQTIWHHKDIVSCVAVSSDGSILVSGSHDTTVMVWIVVHVRSSGRRVRSALTDCTKNGCIIIDNPLHILCGHDDIITCLFVSVVLDIVISGSRDGTCIFHTLQEGKYVRSVQHPSGSPLTKLVASEHGRVILYSNDDLGIHLYSINGEHIASCESNGRLNCIELSWCGAFLICGGDQGQVTVRSMHSLEIVRKYDVAKIITALTITPEESFLVGTRDGFLLLYSIHNQHRSLLTRDLKHPVSSTT